MEDTIAAISSALGVGAISIIRISGDKSFEIISKIFDKDLTNANTHTIHYGHIIDNDEIIGENYGTFTDLQTKIMGASDGDTINLGKDYVYDDAVEQNNYGFSAVKKDGKWGAIDSKGKISQEPRYDLSDYLLVDFIGNWHLGLDLNMNYYNQE